MYFSFDQATTWSQPTYTGWTARDCLGVPGPGDACPAHFGPIGTLPLYLESNLVSDGDPAVAFGPTPGPGGFSWSNGSRLYYANLTASFPGTAGVKGFEGIAISRTDNVQAAAANDKTAWLPPVIVSKQNSALFSDHEMLAVDDAESSPFFGNVYVCNAAFRSQEKSPNSLPEPIVVNTSRDGGSTWQSRQLSAAVNNNVNGGRQDCQVDTDSNGVVYVFWDGFDKKLNSLAIFYVRSFNGGKSFERPARVLTPVVSPGRGGTMDGVAGARDGLTPSISIANGAPSGAGAPNTIAVTYAEGPVNVETAKVWLGDPASAGIDWDGPFTVSQPGDRPMFPAIAISPDGNDLYLTYDAFLQPWQPTLALPRMMQGVVLYSTVPVAPGPWSQLNRGPAGDARGSSANALTDGFLGDYNFAAATNDYGVAVWNDARNALDCPAVDAYRQSLVDGTPIAAPAPQQDCPAGFGNTDIFGGSYPDPTP